MLVPDGEGVRDVVLAVATIDLGIRIPPKEGTLLTAGLEELKANPVSEDVEAVRISRGAAVFTVLISTAGPLLEPSIRSILCPIGALVLLLLFRVLVKPEVGGFAFSSPLGFRLQIDSRIPSSYPTSLLSRGTRISAGMFLSEVSCPVPVTFVSTHFETSLGVFELAKDLAHTHTLVRLSSVVKVEFEIEVEVALEAET